MCKDDAAFTVWKKRWSILVCGSNESGGQETTGKDENPNHYVS